MFDSIQQNYEQKKQQLDKENEQLKKNIRSNQETLSNQLLQGCNDKVQILQTNQELIDKETEAIKQQMGLFQNQTKGWLTMYDELNEEMKKLGDVVNWANMIENNLDNYILTKTKR